MSTLLKTPPNLFATVAEPPVPLQKKRVYAGFFRRSAAQVVDFCIGAALSSVLAVPLIWFVEAVHDDIGMAEFESRLITGVLVFMLWLTVGLILEARATCSHTGATLGKRLLGVMVLRQDGTPLTASQAVARHCAKFLSAFALMVGFVICCVTRKHQCLHDMVAGTIVTHSRTK